MDQQFYWTQIIFEPKIFFRSNLFFEPNIFSNSFLDQKFLSESKYFLNIFFYPTFFSDPKSNFAQIFSEPTKPFDQNCLWIQNFFWPNIFLWPKIFGPAMLLDPKLSLSSNFFWARICLNPKFFSEAKFYSNVNFFQFFFTQFSFGPKNFWHHNSFRPESF